MRRAHVHGFAREYSSKLARPCAASRRECVQGVSTCRAGGGSHDSVGATGEHLELVEQGPQLRRRLLLRRLPLSTACCGTVLPTLCRSRQLRQRSRVLVTGFGRRPRALLA